MRLATHSSCPRWGVYPPVFEIGGIRLPPNIKIMRLFFILILSAQAQEINFSDSLMMLLKMKYQC